MSYASNVAYVQGVSGTFMLPAHSPYEREIVREHVTTRAGRGSTLTLGTQGTRWTITHNTAGDSRCTACAQFLGRLSCSRRDETVMTCFDCAMRAAATNAGNGTESTHE